MRPRTPRKPNNSAGSNFHNKCNIDYKAPRAFVRSPKQNTFNGLKYEHTGDVSDESDQGVFQKKHISSRPDYPVRNKSDPDERQEKSNCGEFETQNKDPDCVMECYTDKNYYSNVVVVDPEPIKSATNYKKINFNVPEESEEQQNPLKPEALEEMDWNDYHSLAVIYKFMDELESNYPSLCSTGDIGTSVEGRTIKILKISNSDASNVSVWMDAGIHAREWIAPAVNTYIADHICRHFDQLPTSIKNKDWYFLPVVNPDGYEYTHTCNRLWRKNRARYASETVGVDLNRNFSLGWGGRGSSGQPSNAFYRGPQPFSEPESSAMRDVFLNSGIKFKVYITLHSYGQIIIFPYACSSTLAPDYVRLLEGATTMSKAIFETNGHIYKVGISRDVMYGAAGTSNDFAHGVAGIPYCYLIELRSKKYKFKLPKEQIEETGNEILNCVKALMEFVDTCKYTKLTDSSTLLSNPEVINKSVSKEDSHVHRGESIIKNHEPCDKRSYSYIRRNDSLMKSSDSYIQWKKQLINAENSFEKTNETLIEKTDSVEKSTDISKKTDCYTSGKNRAKKPGECYLKQTDSNYTTDTSEKGTESCEESESCRCHSGKSPSISDLDESITHFRDIRDSFIIRNSSFLKKTAFFDQEYASFFGSSNSFVNKIDRHGNNIDFLETSNTGIGADVSQSNQYMDRGT